MKNVILCFENKWKLINFAFSTALQVKSKMTDSIKFTKMHGAGNDYVYLDATKSCPPGLPELARRISDRHYGVGSDGLVVILPSGSADFRMRMFNADGSEAQMCGNASRCIGKYVYEKGLTAKREIKLETAAGIKVLSLRLADDGKVKEIRVDMGQPVVDPSLVPAASPGPAPLLMHEVEVGGERLLVSAVSMGNPHGVIFTDCITDRQVLTLGPELECHPLWPEKANIEFARVLDPGHLEMRVWERGSGETMACGTGACATVVAGVLNGLCSRSVDLDLRGGRLHVDWDEGSGHVFLSGGAEFICDGVFYS